LIFKFFIAKIKNDFIFVPASEWKHLPAGVAQLVERQPSKLNVAGSNPVSRSTKPCNFYKVFLLGKYKLNVVTPRRRDLPL
jgi:hypothetical protein